MQTYGIFLVLMIGCLQMGYGQKKQAWVEAANHAFTVEQDYYKAYRYYEAALQYRKDTSDRLHLLFRKAESARLINAYADAQDGYLELVAKAPNDFMAKHPYRCAWAYLGDLQLSRAYSGSDLFDPAPYEKALTYFATYESLAPATAGDCAELVQQGKAIIQFVTRSAGKNLTNASLEVENAGPNVNSEFPDFAPMSWGNRLYFTSFRHAISGKEMDATRYFSRIYLSERGEPAKLLTSINPSAKDTFHVGQTTLNQARDRLYFTRCEYVGQTLQTRCDLYYHQLDPQGNPIGNAIEVTELNLRSSTLTHPSLGWDPVREREVLFFASDRPGTRGNMDIWRSEWIDGHFTAPTNELVINTPGNEITPFYQNGVLYFSSDGQPDRYGGYDIFYTPDPQRREPFNMGQKINSSADESYYSRDKDGNLAYFSSNRLATYTLGVRDDLKESGSQDIYYYLILKPSCTLEVSAFTDCSGNRKALEDVTVTLFDITEGDNIDRQTGMEPSFYGDHTYRFDNVLQPDRKYLIVGTRDGFETQRQVLDFLDGRRPCENGIETVALDFSCDAPTLEVQVYHQNLELHNAVVHIIPLVENARNGAVTSEQKVASGAQIPCSTTANWQLSGTGQQVTGPLTESVPIAFDQTYLVLAQERQLNGVLYGYGIYRASDESDVFCEKTCRDVFRVDVELLPDVKLFFEKGMPGPDPYDVSNLSYLMTLDRYQRRKTAYLDQFPAGATQHQAELELFFNEELDQSFPAFYEFLQQATDLLCQNIPITLEAKACTTPSTVTLTPKQQTYMTHLANRRLESIYQELLGFGLSTERWSDLFTYKTVSGPCEAEPQVPPAVMDAWLEHENAGIAPFHIEAARSRRVELSLSIGKKTEN